MARSAFWSAFPNKVGQSGAESFEAEPTACDLKQAKQYVVMFLASFFVFLALVVFLKWDFFLSTASTAAFDAVDIDHSGSVDLKEIEIAVADMYLEINKYVRVKRPDREEIRAYMEKFDTDNSGELNKAEFTLLVKAIVANGIGRICAIVAVMVASPFVAAALIDYFQEQATDLVKYIPIGRCTREALVAVLPLNEQTATTVISVCLIYVLVPKIFAWYDGVLLGRRAEKRLRQEEERRYAEKRQRQEEELRLREEERQRVEEEEERRDEERRIEESPPSIPKRSIERPCECDGIGHLPAVEYAFAETQ
eukprot:CAMPEP_0172607404 /NCGR_PEP_ID=MMETSP1068-20121228/27592_1 /TAXON_ID=35684 /ORGANISM="Pseudopedinella elastica, Strain CCMP716" /LENGTH=308 /DNA_ID=CAMNT_0013410393 /DNA_START=55 /DNA_END=982 /DNA_ORIENTATION=+